MTKSKYLLLAFLTSLILFIIPTISNAADITVSRNVYSNNGSMKFTFSGLELDITHEYQFGFTKTSGENIDTQYTITDYTATSAIVDIQTTTAKLRDTWNSTDTGYITIKDKTSDTIILSKQNVDLKLPLFHVADTTVLKNGTDLYHGDININIPSRNADHSNAYYQYEKVTDESFISKYKEIKEKNGDYLTLENLIKSSIPTANWKQWSSFSGYGSLVSISGNGRPQNTISVPDSGLYYMWIYFSGSNIKDIYGCILVDNLQSDISLASVSLPSTAKVEMGKTLTLTPTYNPTTATNKILTWSSSDENVATVDNSGKITPKKVGSTIITIVSKDGNKKATCTVTVTQASSKPTDNTTASGKIPYTGLSLGITFFVIAIIAIGFISFHRYKKLKGI